MLLAHLAHVPRRSCARKVVVEGTVGIHHEFLVQAVPNEASGLRPHPDTRSAQRKVVPKAVTSVTSRGFTAVVEVR